MMIIDNKLKKTFIKLIISEDQAIGIYEDELILKGQPKDVFQKILEDEISHEKELIRIIDEMNWNFSGYQIFLLKIKAVLSCDVIKISFADLLKLNSSLILISLRTDRTPFISHDNFVNCNFSSGLSTLPVKKILPSKTFDLTDNRYFLSLIKIRADKFFCIIESSSCVPTVLGSKATLTPVPKTPFEETPAQLDKIIPHRTNNINLNFIF